MSESETKLSNEIIEPMTKDGGAENQPSTETKPVSKEAAATGEDVSAAVCCACCIAGATCVACFPCYIVGLVVRCLLLPCKCATTFCCPPEEKLPVPAPTPALESAK